MRIGRNEGPEGLVSRWYPKIYAGVCESCGVIDPNKPGAVQYKLCPHYAGMDMKCSFCKETANHPEVVRMSTMIIRDDPHVPGQLVTCCNSYECTRRFKEKYGIKD